MPAVVAGIVVSTIIRALEGRSSEGSTPWGLIYRYRGFMAAVLVHGLGDWFVITMIT